MKEGLERDRELAGMNLVAEAVLAYHDKARLGKPLRAKELLAVFDVALQEFQVKVEKAMLEETRILPRPSGQDLVATGYIGLTLCPCCSADLEVETRIRRRA